MSSFTHILYIGVTNNLQRRVIEHREGLIPGFTKKYQCKKLVYYEMYSNIEEAIKREKQLKGWTRNKKIELIKSQNPDVKDLFDELNVIEDPSLRSG